MLQELLDPFLGIKMPAPEGIASTIEGMRSEYEETLRPLKRGIESAVRSVRTGLGSVPPTILITATTGAIWHRKGPKAGLYAGSALVGIGLLGVWSQAVTTLSIVLTAAAICIAIGLPLGVLGARSETVRAVSAPVLDTMQTIPPFVYLVPIVLVIGIGDAAGVIVTAVFAMPPLIRLTTLGINQMMMMALSMTVIASMIAVGGLGQLVLRGIGSLDMTTAAVGGAGIVLLAIALEQMTEPSAGKKRVQDTPP